MGDGLLRKTIIKETLLILSLSILGLACRFYTFEQKSLWIDEVYTFNDSRDGLKGQMKFYKENPTYLHPPCSTCSRMFSIPFQEWSATFV